MSRRRHRGFVFGLSFGSAIAAVAGAARAQDGPPESPPPAFVAPPPGYEPPTQYAQAGPPAPVVEEAAPTFLTLDRMDATTRIGIQLGWDKLDDVELSEGFLTRHEIYGQYVFPGQVGGVYGTLATSHVFDLNSSDATGYGNLDIGGFFLPTHSSELILRAGLGAPTGSGGGNGSLANLLTGFERLTDLLLAQANYATFRLSASTVQRKDNLFLRADGGFDLVIDKPNGPAPSVWFRGNVAVGMRAPGVDITLELVNLAAVDGTVDGGIENRFFHTAGFSLRTQGEDQFHLGTVFPLDDDARGEIWIISAGYQRAMNL
jgi:hypothetical protein